MSLIESYFSGSYNYNGVDYAVLDAQRLYNDQASIEDEMISAVRSEPVYLWKPKAGDKIALSTAGREEISAAGNETVFIKKLNTQGSDLKVYVPLGSNGPLDDSILDKKYLGREAFVEQDGDPITNFVKQHAREDSHIELYLRVPNPDLEVSILHEVIDRPAIILDAHGAGKHYPLNAGDSLKFEDGECLPLPKKEVDVAWKVSDRAMSGSPDAPNSDLVALGTIEHSASRAL